MHEVTILASSILSCHCSVQQEWSLSNEDHACQICAYGAFLSNYVEPCHPHAIAPFKSGFNSMCHELFIH